MSKLESFYDLLFEFSNENRHEILLLIQTSKKRITDLSRELDLNNPETRRHVSRLQKNRLIQRDQDGYYYISPYGETVLKLLRELEFVSLNSKYFESHLLTVLPDRFLQSVGDLTETNSLNNALDYFRGVEVLVKESNSFIWFLVNEFPVLSLSSIIHAIEKGVKIRIIEPQERLLNPDFQSLTIDESEALDRTRFTPLTDQRMLEKVNFNLIVSEKECLISFPTIQHEFDYLGFCGKDSKSLNWSKDLFMYNWDKSKTRTEKSDDPIIEKIQAIERYDSIIIEGTENSQVDVYRVQEAVDKYNEVILRGSFNFGNNSVLIKNNVKIRGEVTDQTPAKIYKKGWRFPFTQFESIFKIDAQNSNVTIENIHFSDFNSTCIWIKRGNEVRINNNKITLPTGYGRGISYGAYGDVIIGIWVEDSETEYFEGNLNIEGNYIDFARGGAYGGFLSRGNLEENPEYRPNLINHEYYMGFGMGIHRCTGTITIQNNTILNVNARGIGVTDNFETAKIIIKNNTIDCDIYGSYPFSSPEAGTGILVQSAWGFPSSGSTIDLVDNSITFKKLNFSGIKILGPTMDRKGAGKLSGGIITGNKIYLKSGYEGIHLRRCDEFEVVNNVLSGKVYYGLRISGRKKMEQDLCSINNTLENNHMKDLEIKKPDAYSNGYADDRMFSKLKDKSRTAHIWLDKDTRSNLVYALESESIFDEGEKNQVFSRARIIKE